MDTTRCPGCGASWNGKRCRSCGYEPFREEPRRRKSSDARKTPSERNRKKHPLIRFLLLLTLIYSLMPLIRTWGLKLEAIEDANRSVTQEAVVPAAEVVTLYRDEDLHIFTTKYDTQHLSDGLTLYLQNDSDRDLILHTDALLINGNTAQQQLYCKAQANAISQNWLRFDPEPESSEIQSVSFRLKAFDIAGNDLLTTDPITLEKDAAKPQF